MAASSIDAAELNPLENVNLTVVLIGCAGSGKSATGNSILGRDAFNVETAISRVTSTCELQTHVRQYGPTISVIDTPAFLDFSAQSELLEEVIKCIHLAKNGIHAVLLILSVTGISIEEEATIHKLKTLFGSQILNYLIVVFTGGDKLEKSGETLEACLGRELPFTFMEILISNNIDCVLVNNKTKNEDKQNEQLEDMLYLVNMLNKRNDGKPYVAEVVDIQEGAEKLLNEPLTPNSLREYSRSEISKFLERQLARRIALVESRVRDTAYKLEQQLLELKGDERAQASSSKGGIPELIRQMTDRLELVESRARDTTNKLELQTTMLKADERVEVEGISELIQQMTDRLEVVESRGREMTAWLKNQLQITTLMVDEKAEGISDLINRLELVESKVSDAATRLELQLAIAEDATVNLERRAQILKLREGFGRDDIDRGGPVPYWKPFMIGILLLACFRV